MLHPHIEWLQQETGLVFENHTFVRVGAAQKSAKACRAEDVAPLAPEEGMERIYVESKCEIRVSIIMSVMGKV
jgi:hypothetical protein